MAIPFARELGNVPGNLSGGQLDKDLRPLGLLRIDADAGLVTVANRQRQRVVYPIGAFGILLVVVGFFDQAQHISQECDMAGFIGMVAFTLIAGHGQLTKWRMYWTMAGELPTRCEISS